MRFEGTLTRWNDERGFGFIEPDQGGEAVFVHIKAMGGLAGQRPQPQQRLSFEVEPGPEGRKRARDVRPVVLSAVRNRRRGAPDGGADARAQRSPLSARSGRPRQTAGTARWGTATLFAIPAFLAVFLVVAIVWRPPGWWALAYLGMSVLAFVAYAIDKSAARQGDWRTKENSLHLLSLAGGWPGALLAQQYLRHKSTKPGFRAVFWLTVIVNVGAFVWLASPWGRHVWA